MVRKYLTSFIILHYLSLTSNAESTITNVWTNEGDRVSIPCPFSPSINGDRAVLVLWFKDSGSESIYSYDARNDDFESGLRWSDEDALGGRSFFSLTSHPPSLVLKPARRGDQGHFTCRVEYLKSPSTFVRVNLSVIIPPDTPVIFWRGREVIGPVGPVVMGTHVELVCQTSGGRPNPIVTWWLQSRQLDSVTEAKVVDGVTVVRSTVVFEATRDMFSVPLSCHALSPNPGKILSQPRTVSTTLNITLPPLTVKVSGLDGPISEGSSVQPVCLTAGSHPLPDIRWFRNNKEINKLSKSIMDGGNITSSSISLHVTKEDNKAYIKCEASNPALPKDLKHSYTLSDSVQLQIFYKPHIFVRLGRVLDASNLIEGKDAFIECVVDSNPPPHRIEWFHDGQPVDSKAGIVIISGPNLALQNLKKGHGGNYRCAADNLEGRSTSGPLRLNIKYSPVCASTKERTQGAALGQNIRILCKVEADPPTNVSFTWSKVLPSGREMTLPPDNVTTSGLASYLEVTPQHLGDFGYFLCRATNSIGKQKKACRITVVSAGPPEPPVNCTASPGSGSLSVTCSEGFHGGFPQKFQIEGWIKGKLVSNLTREFPSWVIENLEDGTELNLKIRSKNAKGFSKYITFDAHMPIAHQQSVTIPEVAENGLGPLLGAIIGAMAVLLILFFVAFVTICRRKRLHNFRRNKKGDSQELQSPDSSRAGDCSPDVVSSVQVRGSGSSPGLDVLDHLFVEAASTSQINQITDNQRITYQRYQHQEEDSPLVEGEENTFKTVYIASPSAQSPSSNKYYVKLFNHTAKPESPYLEPHIRIGDEYKTLDQTLSSHENPGHVTNNISAQYKHPKYKDKLRKGNEEDGGETEEDEEGDKECDIIQREGLVEDLETLATLIENDSLTKVLVKGGSVLSISSVDRPTFDTLRPSCVVISTSKLNMSNDGYGTLGSKRKRHLASPSKDGEEHIEPLINSVTKSTGDCRESTV